MRNIKIRMKKKMVSDVIPVSNVLFIPLVFSTIFSMSRWHRQLKSFLVEGKDPFILYIQYHDCWWPDDTRSQGISSNGVDQVLPESFQLRTRRINPFWLQLYSMSWVLMSWRRKEPGHWHPWYWLYISLHYPIISGISPTIITQKSFGITHIKIYLLTIKWIFFNL